MSLILWECKNESLTKNTNYLYLYTLQKNYMNNKHATRITRFKGKVRTKFSYFSLKYSPWKKYFSLIFIQFYFYSNIIKFAKV